MWDDAGSHGAQGSVWVINSLRLVAIVPGHEVRLRRTGVRPGRAYASADCFLSYRQAPRGPFYDLKPPLTLDGIAIAQLEEALAAGSRPEEYDV